jgi:type 1 fimbriae regulatory protein FimE
MLAPSTEGFEVRSNTIQTHQNRKVEKRTYLSAQEVSQLLTVARNTRHATRDRALILLTFRHGLRASEAVSLQWSQIDLRSARIEVKRLKGSDDSVQPMEADEVRLLHSLKKNSADSAFVFVSERGTVMTADNFLKMIKRLGKQAGLAFNVHPHMLRHGAGFQLINAGANTKKVQAYLGHKNIRHTELYTKLNAAAFKDFGRKIGGKV